VGERGQKVKERVGKEGRKLKRERESGRRGEGEE
jgi:hypothetical protein